MAPCLFPVATIVDAFAKMRRVWESQKAGAQLETRLYDAPHEFNATMQDDAFAWLDRQFQTKNRSRNLPSKSRL